MEGSLVMNNFVKEEGRLIVRDLAGNKLSAFNTVGYYPYRTASITYGKRLVSLSNVRVDYSGDGDNHRVYKVENGYVSVSDGFSFGTEVYERDW